MTEKRLLEIKAQFSAQGWLGFKEAKELLEELDRRAKRKSSSQ